MNDDASVVEVEVEAEVEPDIEPPVGENASGEEILTYLLSTLQGGDREVSATAWQRMQNPDVLDRLVDWFLADTPAIESMFAAIMLVPRCITRARALSASVRRLAQAQRQRTADQRVDDLEDQLDQLISVDASLGQGGPPVALIDPAVIAQLRVPRGYQIDNSGVYRLAAGPDGEVSRHRIANAPIFLSARTSNLMTGEARRQALWRGAGGWCGRVVDRRVILDSRRIMELADLEAPVSSNTTSQLISFLSDFEAENAHRLPSIRTSPHMGWLPGNSFLLPDVHYTPDTNMGRLSLTTAPGHEAVMQGWTQTGDPDKWRRAVDLVGDFPFAMIALYASLATPLLRILNVPSFIVDFSGETSGGKSTILRLAASVWGRPADSLPTAMYSWDATKVWIERTAGMLHSLPLILDETKRAKHPGIVRDVIYDFCQGQGRGRGSITGVQEVSTWRSILISSGEGAATSFSQDGGTRARVITLKGRPLGDDPEVGGRVSEEVQAIVHENHGWLGREMIRYLVANEAQWDRIKEVYEATRLKYVDASKTAVGRRHAAHIAVLDVAASIAHQLGVPRPSQDPFMVLVSSQELASQDADRPRAALEDVATWCAMNQTCFWGRNESFSDGAPKVPHNGWYGAWCDWETWDYIAVTTVTLKRVLKELGHRPDEVLQRWKDREWLHTRGKYHASVSVRVGKASVKCYCIKREIIDVVMDDAV
jgi:uncharacterized protein (DUF927 family)|tara:strand:+ start:10877 stop:13006 length:2130 start_codon:yes stop_codon:yes gene_type:complete